MSRFKSLLAGMEVVDISEAEGGYNYYGYVRANGEWAIMRELVAGTEYRFVIGASAYSTNWTARTSLNYTLPTTI